MQNEFHICCWRRQTKSPSRHELTASVVWWLDSRISEIWESFTFFFFFFYMAQGEIGASLNRCLKTLQGLILCKFISPPLSHNKVCLRPVVIDWLSETRAELVLHGTSLTEGRESLKKQKTEKQSSRCSSSLKVEPTHTWASSVASVWSNLPPVFPRQNDNKWRDFSWEISFELALN